MATAKDRILGARETLFYVLDQYRPKHFAVMAGIEGPTDRKGWEDALQQLQHRHPLLTRFISKDEHATLLFRHSPGNGIPVRWIEQHDPVDWNSEIEKELKQGFDITKAPLARVVLDHTPERSTLLFLIHHSIADGLSVVHMINHLLMALSGSHLERLRLMPSADDFLGLVKATDTIDPIIQKVRYRTYDSSLRVATLRFSTGLTGRLIQRAKIENTSVHGALSAAVVMAARSLPLSSNPDTINILSPVSTRAAQRADDDCGLFILSKAVAFALNDETGFWEIARQAKAALAETGSLGFFADSTIGLRKMMQGHRDIMPILQSNLKFDLMLSNLGSYPYNTTYGSLRLTDLTGPFIVSGFDREQTIGASTVNGRLCLAHTGNPAIVHLLKTIREVIEKVCEHVPQMSTALSQ